MNAEKKRVGREGNMNNILPQLFPDSDLDLGGEKRHTTQPTQIRNRYNDQNRKILCCNCGKPGHVYRRCFQPVTSLGIICAYSKRKIQPNKIKNEVLTRTFDLSLPESNDLRFIFIRRKDSLSFAEIARARYKVNDKEYIRKMLARMTKDEIEFLRNVKTADEIWYRLWTWKKNSKSRQTEYFRAKKKLQTLIDGVTTPKEIFSFSSLLDEITPQWDEPEWGFPKGRRVPRESDIDCAKREFLEETDISPDKLHILPTQPVEEVFVGSNGIKYKHIYYLAYCDEEIPLSVNAKNRHQKAEISAISWLTPDEIIEKIRCNYPGRKILVACVARFLESISEFPLTNILSEDQET